MGDLTKQITYDYTMLSDGVVQAREITKVFEDDELLSTSYYRFNGAIPPGTTLPEELPTNMKNGILTSWTQEVIDNYNAAHATISG